MKHLLILILALYFNKIVAQCDSAFTYYEQLPSNVTILVGDSCFLTKDINVLDSIVNKNNLDYQTPLELGTQTWFNGRLRFLVAGNYGNNTGVNDTIYFLPENMGDLDDLASLYATGSAQGKVAVTVEGVTDFRKYAEINKYFKNLSPVLSSTLKYMEPNFSRFELRIEGQPEQLIEIVRLDGVLRIVKRSSGEDGALLVYKLED